MTIFCFLEYNIFDYQIAKYNILYLAGWNLPSSIDPRISFLEFCNRVTQLHSGFPAQEDFVRNAAHPCEPVLIIKCELARKKERSKYYSEQYRRTKGKPQLKALSVRIAH